MGFDGRKEAELICDGTGLEASGKALGYGLVTWSLGSQFKHHCKSIS